MLLNIGILGEYLDDRPPRKSIKTAFDNSAKFLNLEVIPKWIINSNINLSEIVEFDGIFIAPGGALETYDNILKAIKIVREKNIPCIGTCGGFQRILTEYAINVLEEKTVLHEESDPDAINPLFSKLLCSISSNKSEVILKNESLVSKYYNANVIEEEFYCSYGLNSNYVDRFIKNGINISGIDKNGSVRIVEVAKHPFMIGTLFVPQVNSSESKPHVLITEFLKAALTKKKVVGTYA